MGAKVQMLGQRFGRWTVLRQSAERDKNGGIRYVCKCDCGTEKTVKGASLRFGASISCGCYNRDVIQKFGKSVYKEKLYSVWNSMKQRCSNPNDKAYANYGGRGIKVCAEWEHDYFAFKKWALENGYKPGLWIERCDNAKDYSPDNCKWETPKRQQRNKRTNLRVMIGGVEKCIAEWAELSGIPFATLERRIELGWPEEKLLSPIDKRYSHSEAIRAAINPQKEITITRIIDPAQEAQMRIEDMEAQI